MSRHNIPAWKKLGLKLKYANETTQDSGLNSVPQGASAYIVDNGHESVQGDHSESVRPPKKKRKTEKVANDPAPITTNDTKVLSDGTSSAPEIDASRPKKSKKSVSFSADTIPPVHPSDSIATQPESSNIQPRTKSKSKSKQKSKQIPTRKLHPSVKYLEQYDTSRSSWKFSKNRETWLLRHIFSTADIPCEYNNALARYFHGSQSANARLRLEKDCEKVLQKDEGAAQGERNHQEDWRNARDEEFQRRFVGELEQKSNLDSKSGSEDEYKSWIQRQSRAKLLLWSLRGSSTMESIAPKPKEKKRKNRTAVVEDENSSSSESGDSTTDSEDGSTDDTSSSGSSTISEDDEGSD